MTSHHDDRPRTPNNHSSHIYTGNNNNRSVYPSRPDGNQLLPNKVSTPDALDGPSSLQYRDRINNPLYKTARSELQDKRVAVNERINKEMRMRMGAETLLKASQGKKQRHKVELEIKYVDSNLQLLKSDLEELNSALGTYQQLNTLPMIPLAMKATIPIDFNVPFRNFILDHYSQVPDPFSEAIESVTGMRERVLAAPRSEGSIQLFLQYFDLLNILDLRFFSPNGNLGLVFTWFDSFTGVPFQQKSIAFEKASILFNLAGLYSQLATALDRTKVESLSLAIKWFQYSAGTLDYIRDHYTHAPNADMQPDIINMLEGVMKAQAQECYLLQLPLKEVMEREEDKVRYELNYAAESLVVSERNDVIYNNLQTNLLQHVDTLPYTWVALIQMKASYYAATAYQSVAVAMELVARLQREWGSGERAQFLIADALERLKWLTNGKHFVRPPQTDWEFLRLALSCSEEAATHMDEAAQMLDLNKHLRTIDPIVRRIQETKISLHNRMQRLEQEMNTSFQLALAASPSPHVSEKSVHTKSSRKSSAAKQQNETTNSISSISSRALLDLQPHMPRFQGRSECLCEPIRPSFDSVRTADPFRALGPITAFNAKCKYSAPKTVTIAKQQTGGPGSVPSYGFSLSGEQPCVLINVEQFSAAYNAGLRRNDILLSVEGEDIRWASHAAITQKIVQASQNSLQCAMTEQLTLTVITPLGRILAPLSSSSIREEGAPGSTPTQETPTSPAQFWTQSNKMIGNGTVQESKQSWKKRLSGTWLFRRKTTNLQRSDTYNS